MRKVRLVIELTLIALLLAGLANAQCPVPAGLSDVSLNTTDAQLNWSAVAGATGYRLEIQNGQNNPVFFRITPSTTGNTYSVTGLTSGSIYKFKVRTVCSGGDKSNWSPWYTFAAGGGTFNCTQLTGLIVSSTTASGATFSWNSSAGGLGYAVRVEDASGNPINFLFNANTTANSYTVSGLNASSNYKVKVRKRCAPGITGPWTSWLFFTTPALRIADPSPAATAYPNPASTELNIPLTAADLQNTTTVSLFDISGRQIQTVTIPAGSEALQTTLPVTGHPEGIYLLRIESADRIHTQRITIIH